MKITNPEPLLRSGIRQDRITICTNAYFEHHGDQPVHVSCAHSHFSRTFGEQPYSRRVAVGESWQGLDLGWFSGNASAVGMVFLENLAGRSLEVQPTEAERLELESRVIEISFDGERPSLMVLPGMMQPLMVCNALLVSIRCRSGMTDCRIVLFPG